VPTTYTLDLNTGLVQVLVQQEATSTTRYLYGVTRLGEQQPGGWAYHLGDALGSVRQLADDAAQVTLARGYMPYGEPLWSVGNGSSAYGFTGEDWDVTTQLLFLRTRYYASTREIPDRGSVAGESAKPSKSTSVIAMVTTTRFNTPILAVFNPIHFMIHSILGCVPAGTTL